MLPVLGPPNAAGGPGAGDDEPISLYSSHRPRLRGRAGTAASTASTLLVVALVALILTSPAAAAFRNGFLNVHQMWVALAGHPEQIGIALRQPRNERSPGIIAKAEHLIVRRRRKARGRGGNK